MNSLLINTIISSEQDSEITTYKILGTLKEYLSNIRKNKIYPALSELVGLAVKLESLKKSIAKNAHKDEDLFIFDDENLSDGDMQWENHSNDDEDISVYLDWIISQVNPILEEGIAVYEFVDQNMEVKLIHGNPLYKEEGYLVIPDNKISIFNIYRFNCELNKSKNYPEKSIKTEFIKSWQGIGSVNNKIQTQNIIDYLGNNSQPVYLCETELDFPYEETIFQMARKKLLSILSF
jgi:hypothetical protein